MHKIKTKKHFKMKIESATFYVVENDGKACTHAATSRRG
jgi:hypothetical protein